MTELLLVARAIVMVCPMMTILESIRDRRGHKTGSIMCWYLANPLDESYNEWIDWYVSHDGCLQQIIERRRGE
jgi:hypothetical protein